MASSPHAPDFPGLLPLGLHLKTLEDLQDLCVTPFATSRTRATLMGNLQYVSKRLSDALLPIDLWIDGSFVTEKLDPRDIDVVARVPEHVYNSGNQTMLDALAWLTDDARQGDLSLDAYEFSDFPQNSPMYPLTRDQIKYWSDLFSGSRSGHYTKGIAVIQICGGVT